MSAEALIAACHAKACAPPPVGRGGSGGGGGGGRNLSVVQRSSRAETRRAGGGSKPSVIGESPSHIKVSGNRPDGRYEKRYIGEDLKHPAVVKAKAAAAQTGKTHYVTKEARGVLSHERKRTISTEEPPGSHLRVEPSGKVHQVLPRVIRVNPSRTAKSRNVPTTSRNKVLQPA